MKTDELFEHAKTTAIKTLTETGKILSMIYLHVEDDDGLKVLAFVYEGLDRDMQRDVIVKVARMSRLAGKFHGIVMVSETWMSSPKPGKDLNQVMRPSQDPHRKEAVAVYAIGEECSKRFGVFSIVRDAAGKPSVNADKDEAKGIDRVESWLDEILENGIKAN